MAIEIIVLSMAAFYSSFSHNQITKLPFSCIETACVRSGAMIFVSIVSKATGSGLSYSVSMAI